jgi:hypothetical protein
LKHLLIALVLTSGSTNAIAQTTSLREHMRAMGYLLDEINSRSSEPLKFSEAAAKTRELRRGMIQSLAFDPPKFATMNERTANAARLEYHQFLARVIYLSATLERVMDADSDSQTQSGTRLGDIRNILHEINVQVGRAHGKFRD